MEWKSAALQPSYVRSRRYVRKGLHKADKAAAYSFFLHFLLRSQQCHLGSKTGSFHAQHPAARLRAHFCERSQRKNAQTAWKTAAIYTFAALVYPPHSI